MDSDKTTPQPQPDLLLRDLIPKLIQNGAVGIIEYPLNKVI